MGLAKKKYKFEPDYAVSPGETLFEVMQSLDMNQKELGQRTGLTVQSLNRIFKGIQPITYETANRLELATGVPASFWNNLEANYREQLTKIEERNRLAKALDWLKKIPTNELIRRGVLSATKDKVQLLRETLKFFGVSSVESWYQFWGSPAVAARRSPCFETRLEAAATWIRLGELQARKINCKPYDKHRFREALSQIRNLTRETPEVFEPEMKRLCAESGVALALVKEMKKVPWNGATKWLTPTKAMILLNLRGKGEDKFWFSFFHEAGHVLNDGKRNLFINDGSHQDPREIRADVFAMKFLIHPKYDRIIQNARSKEDIVRIANELGISPGIVAGRYQFLTKNWDRFNKLIRQFKWAEES